MNNEPLKPTWVSTCGRATLYLADCLTIIPAAPDAGVLVTDPPYGVGLGQHKGATDQRSRELARSGYVNFDDSPENFSSLIVPRLREGIATTVRGLVFCAGTKMWELPVPDCVGGVFLAAGAGRTAWGFQCLSHFLLYGQCPDLNLGAKPTAWASSASAKKNGHPCPKPVEWMIRAVALASRDGETVVDPFMGSGTTGIACLQMDRRFIGIESDPGYFEIARRRIEDEISGSLFLSKASE